MSKALFLSFITGIALLAACNSSKKTASPTETETTMQTDVITDRKWKLVELYGKPVADQINGKTPFIQLQKSDSRYAANAGCNGIGGQFILKKHNRIEFKRGLSTMMACQNMEIEQDLINALQTADNYTVNGKNLSLNKARMAPLARFEEIAQ